MRISVDLDGVLAETMIVWCKLCNQLHAKNIRFTDMTDWGGWRIAGITRDEFFRLLDMAWKYWEEIPPTEADLDQKVGRLRKYGGVDVVTGRTQTTVKAARRWLKKWRIPFDDFVLVSGVREKVGLKYDIFVDDAPKLMEDLSERTARYGILYARPWNDSLPKLPRIFRVKAWNEVPSVVEKIASRLRH